MPRIRDKLADWSRDELAELVERMVHREPELQLMLETPPPGRASVVQVHDIEAQIRQGFGIASRGGWRQSHALARQLEDLAELGLAHAARAEPAALPFSQRSLQEFATTTTRSTTTRAKSPGSSTSASPASNSVSQAPSQPLAPRRCVRLRRP